MASLTVAFTEQLCELPPSPYLQFSPLAYRAAKGALAGVLLLTAASVLAIAGLSLSWPLVHDAAIIQYIGWLMHQGAVPYRDVFDMNFPGTYVVHWLVLFIPGDMDLVWRCFDLGLLVATLVLLVKLLPAKHYWSAAATCVAFAIYYLGLGPFFANGERDMLMTPLMIGGVVVNVAMLERAQPRAWLAFLAGLLFGAACTIKPTGIAMAVMQIGFSGLWLLRGGQSWKRVTAILTAAFLGVSLPIAGVLAWLYFAGGLAAFFDIEMRYLPIYVNCYRQCTDWSGWWNAYPLNILLTAAFPTSIYMAFTSRMTARFGAAAVAVLAAIAHFVLQQKGFGFPYHMIPMMALLMPVAFWTLDEVVSSRVIWRWGLVAGLAAMVILPECGRVCSGAIRGDAEPARRHRESLELAHYLRANLRPGETVQLFEMVDGGLDALLQAGVPSSTRFLGDCFFFCHDPDIPYVAALRKEFLADLTHRRPQFIVVYRVCWFLDSGYRRLDTFPELREWLEANYVRRFARHNYWILERNDP